MTMFQPRFRKHAFKPKFPIRTRAEGRAATRIQRRFRRVRLARTAVSRSRISLNKKIFNALRNYGETKLIPTITVSPSASGEADGTPVRRTIGGSAQPGFYWGGLLGVRPSSWDANIRQLNGTSLPEGFGGAQRVGDYVFLKKTHLTFQIDMAATNNPGHTPIQFRLLVIKAREAVTPAGLTFTPDHTLFLQNTGQSNGYLSVASDEVQPMNEFQIQNMPINKRNWVVFRDQRFIMSPPQQADTTGNLFYTPKYPIRKTFTLNLRHLKKTKYQDIAGSNVNQPINYDPKYVVLIFAQPMGNTSNLASAWTVHMTGTTSYTDS